MEGGVAGANGQCGMGYVIVLRCACAAGLALLLPDTSGTKIELLS